MWEHVGWAAGGWAKVPWSAETWVVHVQHVQWQLLSSYQAVPSFPDDQTCCVGAGNAESKPRQHQLKVS